MTISTNAIQKVTGMNIASPKGFSAGGIHCGIKHKKLDLGLLVSDVPASAAGVYTTNRVQAAPLIVTKNSLEKEGKLQAIIVNSGNANSCTGEQGLIDAKIMQQKTAEKLHIENHLVGVASTGVIGERLPIEPIVSGIQAVQTESGLKGSIDFSQSILTTDTVMKNTSYRFEIDGKEITISGTAKGSGMIHPNMATMLGFLTTDANISPVFLEDALKETVDQTFNCITVDGDTSTNDTVMIMANGLAENDPLTPEHPDWNVFTRALYLVCEELGKMIAQDGEGATKLIEVCVEGALTNEDARKAAKTVVGSPLVKTAVFGCDANWGRIMSAIGYSGIPLEIHHLQIFIGPIQVVKDGLPFPFIEEKVESYLKRKEIAISVNLGMGGGKGTAWGCDLTYDYVQINASYRT